MGIGHPANKDLVSKHVLEDFTEDENQEMSKAIGNIGTSLSILLEKKLDLFSSKVNEEKK